jgi:hypothetical protein
MEGVAVGLEGLIQQLAHSQVLTQQTLQVLVQQQQQPASRLPRGLRISDYRQLEEGRKQVRPWAEGVGAWLNVVRWNLPDQQAQQMAILYFAGRMATNKVASQWWSSRVREAQGAQHGGFATLHQFLDQLVKSCGEQNAMERARDGIMGLRQTGSAMDYATRFGALAADLPAEEGAGWLAYLFKKGLKTNLRAIILGKFGEEATWLQIRDIAVVHDRVALEVAAAAATTSSSGAADPMELGLASDDESEGSRGGRARERKRWEDQRRSRSSTPHPGDRSGKEGALLDNKRVSFQGKCFKCQQFGHRAADCKQAKK